MKRPICFLLSILSASIAIAQTNEESVNLAGLVDALGMKSAVVVSRTASAGFRGNVILKEGDAMGAIKVVKIDSASGTIDAVVAGKTCSLTLNESVGSESANKTVHLAPPLIDLVSVNLDAAISLYADFKSHTVLQHPQLKDRLFSLECNPHSMAEAAAAFEKMFNDHQIATIPDGDKFVMIVPFALTNTLTPSADAIVATNASLPALSVNFKTAPVPMVLQIYSDFLGKKIVNSGDVPGFPPITFVQTTPLSKAQILYALETQIAWRNFRFVPDGSGNLKCERIR